jgi:hypothetical protein
MRSPVQAERVRESLQHAALAFRENPVLTLFAARLASNLIFL